MKRGLLGKLNSTKNSIDFECIEHPLLKNKMYEAVPTVYAHIGFLNFETLGKKVIQKY